MGVKADLKIRLLANDVIVAESNDAALWNRVFSAIAAGSSESITASQGNGDKGAADGFNSGHGAPPAKSAVEKFAEELGVGVEDLVAACNPQDEPPYIYLNEECWDTLRGYTGSRGKNAVAPVALAITLLALWQQYRDNATAPSVAEAKSVLDTIELQDKNPARSLKNCEWLNECGDGWVINAAQRTRAEKLAKAYIKKESLGFYRGVSVAKKPGR